MAVAIATCSLPAPLAAFPNAPAGPFLSLMEPVAPGFLPLSVGDLMIAFLTCPYGTTPAPPNGSGFHFLGQTISGSGDPAVFQMVTQVWYKVVTLASIVTYQWGFNPTYNNLPFFPARPCAQQIGIIRVTGASTSSPIADYADSNTMTAPSVTLTNPSGGLFIAIMMRPLPNPAGPSDTWLPAGFTDSTVHLVANAVPAMDYFGDISAGVRSIVVQEAVIAPQVSAPVVFTPGSAFFHDAHATHALAINAPLVFNTVGCSPDSVD